MYAMDPDLNDESVHRQLMGFAHDLMGYSKPTATVTVPPEFDEAQDIEITSLPGRERSVACCLCVRGR